MYDVLNEGYTQKHAASLGVLGNQVLLQNNVMRNEFWMNLIRGLDDTILISL